MLEVLKKQNRWFSKRKMVTYVSSGIVIVSISYLMAGFAFQSMTDADFSSADSSITEADMQRLKDSYSLTKEDLTVNGFNFDANMEKAELLTGVGEYDKALVVYRVVGVMYFKDARPQKGMGDVYFSQGKYDEAEKMYLAAIKKDRHYLKAYYQLSDIYRYYRKDDRAKIDKFYQESINNLGEDRYIFYQSYAYFLEDNGDYAKAIEQLKKILVKYPDDTKVKAKTVELEAKVEKTIQEAQKVSR